MKFQWIICLVIYFLFTQDYLIGQLDSLNNLKSLKEKQIQTLKDEIISLEKEIEKEKIENIRKKYAKQLNNGFELKMSGSGVLHLGSNNPDPSNYKRYDAGAIIIIYPEIIAFGTDYSYRAEYDGNIGWISSFFMGKDEKLLPFNDLLAETKIEAKDKRKKEIEKATLERYSKYPRKFRTAIMNGRVMIGMSKRAVIESLGNPSNENKDTSRYGTRTQMVYLGGEYDYVYLENGIVVTFTESK